MKLELVRLSSTELAILHNNDVPQQATVHYYYQFYEDNPYYGTTVRTFYTNDAMYILHPDFTLEERKHIEVTPIPFFAKITYFPPKNVIEKEDRIIIEY